MAAALGEDNGVSPFATGKDILAFKYTSVT
jgi:hypothetical protein